MCHNAMSVYVKLPLQVINQQSAHCLAWTKKIQSQLKQQAVMRAYLFVYITMASYIDT